MLIVELDSIQFDSFKKMNGVIGVGKRYYKVFDYGVYIVIYQENMIVYVFKQFNVQWGYKWFVRVLIVVCSGMFFLIRSR